MAERLRILFAGGGTGGHLYPGLTVAQALKDRQGEAEIAFFVTRRDIDRHVLENEPYMAQFEDTRGFSTCPWTWPAFGLHLLTNQRRAREFLASFRPAAVVGLGGFGSYAAVREAQKAGLPNFILNPDLKVGRANRRLAPGASAVFCQFTETMSELPAGRGRVEVVGCPVRASLFGIDRREACDSLGLDPERKTLVVFGGGLGARSINRTFARLAARLDQFGLWQVLHLTGKADFDEVRKTVATPGSRYRVRDYVDEMGQVYAAADVVVSRVGASTVAELTALGVPSVLMPYPFHRDRHQEHHARLLEEAGAAVMVPDRVDVARNCDALWQVLPQLMEDDDRRRRMADAARSLGHPKAARSIASAIISALSRGESR